MPKKSSKSRKSKRSAPKRRAQKLSPVPPGMRTVTPYLFISGAAQALEFYKKAFNAKELTRQDAPGGKLMHAMIKIGDTRVMMADEFPGGMTKAPTSVGATTAMLHVYTKDVDKLFAQAVAAGAKVEAPLDDTFWGERYGQLSDPFGHVWSLSMRIPMTRQEKEAKQREAMASFAAAESHEAQPPS